MRQKFQDTNPKIQINTNVQILKTPNLSEQDISKIELLRIGFYLFFGFWDLVVIPKVDVLKNDVFGKIGIENLKKKAFAFHYDSFQEECETVFGLLLQRLLKTLPGLDKTHRKLE
ncbi:hypothetical protein N9164_00395 [Draconibacterium sp.]|nr:hypothetical protein [Draconibacterium sp.]